MPRPRLVRPALPSPALLAAAGLWLGAGQAQASLFCLIPKTPDGFVALRSEPRAQSHPVLRMRPGDEVQIIGDTGGSWTKVWHWRGETRLSKGPGGFATGYVARRFLDECG